MNPLASNVSMLSSHASFSARPPSEEPPPSQTPAEPPLRPSPRSLHFRNVVGRSPALCAAIEDAEKIAASRTPVLIVGESGTGKELIARGIHLASDRGHRPFVRVDGASLSISSFEHGRFGLDQAHGGTLFLDDLDRLPTSVQQMLLRAAHEGAFDRSMPDPSAALDVRIIVSTERDLSGERDSHPLGAGLFRAGLAERLHFVEIRIPPLRERLEDIPALAAAMTAETVLREGRTIDRIPQATLERLVRHDWPGNVQELRNVIERAIDVSEGGVLTLPEPLRSAPPREGTARGRRQANHFDVPVTLPGSNGPIAEIEPGSKLDDLIDDYKRALVDQALNQSGGNHRRAAALLGIHRSSFTRMLHRLMDARDRSH